MLMKGPRGRFSYARNMKRAIGAARALPLLVPAAGAARCIQPMHLAHIQTHAPHTCTGMIAGGTGITPMYQVAMAILKDPADTTQLSLVFGNISEDDILLRAELDDLAAAHPGRFKVYHVLNKAPSKWDGGSGFITKDVLAARLPPAGAGTLVLRCGPKPMNDAMKGYLDDLGYEEEAQFEF